MKSSKGDCDCLWLDNIITPPGEGSAVTCTVVNPQSTAITRGSPIKLIITSFEVCQCDSVTVWQCEVLQHQLKTGVCPALYCTGHCCTAAVREIAGISAARCPVLGDCRTDVFQFNVWWYSRVWGLVSVLSGYRLTKVLYYTATNVLSKNTVIYLTSEGSPRTFWLFSRIIFP